MCVLGRRLLKDIDPDNCTKEAGGDLYNIFCPDDKCDPYFLGEFVFQSIHYNVKVLIKIPNFPHSLQYKCHSRYQRSFKWSFLWKFNAFIPWCGYHFMFKFNSFIKLHSCFTFEWKWKRWNSDCFWVWRLDFVIYLLWYCTIFNYMEKKVYWEYSRTVPLVTGGLSMSIAKWSQ